jgi:hypothetical protein
LAVLLATSLVAGAARAATTPRIAVVHELSADERAVGRLRAELSTLGFEVVDVTLAPNEGATALDDAARRVNAFAAIHVVPSQGGVEVWIADSSTGKTLRRELVIGPGDPFDDVVALRAAEILRARLAELGLAPKRSEAKQAFDTTPSPPKAKSEARSFFLELGPGAALSPGGLEATVHGFVGVRWRTWTTVGFDVFVAFPITAATISEPEGSASVRPSLGGIDIAAWFFDATAAWQATAGAGISLANLAIEADPVPPLLGRSERSTMAMPFGRLSLARAIGPRFRVGLDAFLGVTLSRAVIRFDDREVAHWGQPLFLSAVSLGVALD